ncbi:MAG: dTDP-4-dehydrorhamnose reductase [Myxococcales bacterium]|nr:dTDP-4-dehydrorhamnose reductase [Myxococcales bacterium]
MADRHTLVLGGGGMLGRAFVAALTARGQRVLALDRPELELAAPENVETHVAEGVQLVVNCAAYTDVDGAERDEATATRINGQALAELSSCCARRGALLLSFGTDYVFSGDGTRPYRVDDALAPLNAYGRGKALGEQALRDGPADFLLVRTSWLYAPWGQNFVRTMARLGAERERLKVVDDQHGRPTSAQYLVERSLALVERGARGIFHATDGGQCSWYQLASAVIAGLGLDCKVEPCSSAEMPRPAPRPAYSVLDLSQTEGLIGPSRPWRENLADVLAQLDAY